MDPVVENATPIPFATSHPTSHTPSTSYSFVEFIHSFLCEKIVISSLYRDDVSPFFLFVIGETSILTLAGILCHRS